VSRVNVAPEALTLQVIPGTWDGTDTSVVSPPFPPPAGSLDFTVFPAFFDDFSLTTAGTYSAPYKIEVIDTSTGNPIETLPFDLTGSANPLQDRDVVFVLDRGWSMGGTDASGVTRLTRLKAAFTRGIALLRSTDTFSVVSFANVKNITNPFLGVGDGGSIRQGLAIDLANGLAVDRKSPTVKCIQMGFDAGRLLSETATLVLMTDAMNANASGHELHKPLLPTSALIISETPGSPPANINDLYSEGGSYAIAAPQTLGEFALEKLLSQILIGLAGNVVVEDPEGSLLPGQSLSYPLRIVEADREIELIVFSNDAEALDVRVLLDSGSVLASAEPTCGKKDPKDDGVTRDKGVLVLRWAVPPDNKDKGKGNDKGNDKDNDFPYSDLKVVISRSIETPNTNTPVTFNLIAAARSDLMFDAQVTSTGTEVGSELLFSAVLSQFGHTGHFPDAKVKVKLTHPDGFAQTLDLEHVSKAPGRFQASLRSFRTGTYTAHFIATGRPMFLKHHRHHHKQQVFRRECVRTIAVFSPSRCCPREDPCGFSNT